MVSSASGTWPASGRAVQHRDGQDGPPRHLLTPDGATLIASAEYTYVGGKPVGGVVVRDAKDGTRPESRPMTTDTGHPLRGDRRPKAKSSSPRRGRERDIRVWDAEQTGLRSARLKGHWRRRSGAVIYSPDGKTLASAGDNSVRLWDVDTGAVRKVLRGHQKSVETVAFSGDGQVLASGGFDETARAWDVATGKLLATFQHDDPVLAVAISPDGKAIASASARWGDGFYGQAPANVQVWDVATSKPIATLPEQPNQVFAVVFTPDGKSLITASLSGAVTLWDLASFQDDKGSPKPVPPEDR